MQRKSRNHSLEEQKHKELYKSNLLSEYQGMVHLSQFQVYRSLTPEKNIDRLKEIIRSYLKAKRGAAS